MAEGESESGEGMLAVHHSPLVKREIEHHDINQVWTTLLYSIIFSNYWAFNFCESCAQLQNDFFGVLLFYYSIFSRQVFAVVCFGAMQKIY